MNRFTTLTLAFCILLSGYSLQASALDTGLLQPVSENHTTSLPLSFLENKGQVTDQYGNSRPDIDFKIGNAGVIVFIGKGKIHYQWAKIENQPSIKEAIRNESDLFNPDSPQSYETYRMDVELIGSNKSANIITESKSDYYERYYLPQFGEKGESAYSFHKITYRDIYPNIDWVLYIKDNKMKYDFVVRPGGKISDISLKYSGATTLRINEDGDLTATTPMGNVKDQAPQSFQEDGAKIASRFILKDDVLTFKVAAYSGILTIDPAIEWGTYYGGISAEWLKGGYAFSNSAVYVCGGTSSADNIATTGSYQNTFGGGGILLSEDAMLVKFNSDGVRQWATYYGSSGNDGFDCNISCDSSGNIYLASLTTSDNNIATTGSFQPSKSPSNKAAYLVKFNSSGERIWGTYYGGISESAVSHCRIACGLEGDVYLYFTTSEQGLATPGSAFEEPSTNGIPGSILVKFNDSGIQQWATYYFGSASGVVCDDSGNVYIVGYSATSSVVDYSIYTTPGSFQPNPLGAVDAILVKFNGSGIRQWATFIGGEGYDGQALPSSFFNFSGGNVCVDRWGNVYMAMVTMSQNGIVTPGSHQDTFGGGETDGFIQKFDASGTRLWGTYYGGNGDDGIFGITCDIIGSLYVTGVTSSQNNIAVNGSYQSNLGGGSDAFLAKFDTSGARTWATYYGGQGILDGGFYVFTDASGNVYFDGMTGGLDSMHVTQGSHQEQFGGLLDGFLAKFCFAVIPPDEAIVGDDSVCANSSETYSLQGIDNADTYLWTLPSGWSGNSDSNSITVNAGTTGGLISVQIVRCGDTSNVQIKTLYIRAAIQPVITVDGFVLGTVGTFTTYQWCLNGSPVDNAVNPTYIIAANGDYTVITTDSFGCTDTSEVYTVTNYTGIEDVSALAHTVTVYPNPAQDKVHIQFPAYVNVSISNMEGKLVLYQEKVKTIDISSLSPGIYLLHIMDKNNTSIKVVKLVKLK